LGFFEGTEDSDDTDEDSIPLEMAVGQTVRIFVPKIEERRFSETSAELGPSEGVPMDEVSKGTPNDNVGMGVLPRSADCMLLPGLKELCGVVSIEGIESEGEGSLGGAALDALSRFCEVTTLNSEEMEVGDPKTKEDIRE
jgi:hypothetical protein